MKISGKRGSQWMRHRMCGKWTPTRQNWRKTTQKKQSLSQGRTSNGVFKKKTKTKSYRKTRSPKKTSEMFQDVGILELESTVIVQSSVLSLWRWKIRNDLENNLRVRRQKVQMQGVRDNQVVRIYAKEEANAELWTLAEKGDKASLPPPHPPFLNFC